MQLQQRSAKATDPVYQDGVDPGKIFKQSVAQGTNVEEGAAPAPTEQVAVPDLTTLSLAQAQAVCKSAGLVCKYLGDEYGAVTAQSVAPATKVDRGTTVTVTLTLLDQ